MSRQPLARLVPCQPILVSFLSPIDLVVFSHVDRAFAPAHGREPPPPSLSDLIRHNHELLNIHKPECHCAWNRLVQ